MFQQEMICSLLFIHFYLFVSVVYSDTRLLVNSWLAWKDTRTGWSCPAKPVHNLPEILSQFPNDSRLPILTLRFRHVLPPAQWFPAVTRIISVSVM